MLQLFLKVGISSKLLPALLPPGAEHSSAEDTWDVSVRLCPGQLQELVKHVNMNAPRSGQPAKPCVRHIRLEFYLSRDAESPFLELAGHCMGMDD